MTRHFTSLDALNEAVGLELGPTEWVTIDQPAVNQFADLTGDHQWIHVDVDRASASPFGGTIAHGHLILSLLPGFASELYSIDLGTSRLNYGLNAVRFPASVPVGSAVRGSVIIAEVTHTPSGLRVTAKWTVEAKSGDRPVCVAESVTLVVGIGGQE